MKTEFTTFRVIEGKEERAREWMDLLTQRKNECVETLPREKMVYESIFMYEKEGRMFLSWFSIQKDIHEKVETSEHDIDRLHLEFWDECIDREFEPEDHYHVVSFLPNEMEGTISALYEE